MKRTTEITTLKSSKGTKTLRLAALAASCSVAAIIGIAVMKSNEPTVAGHAYTSENKVAVVASDKKVLKSDVETPEQPDQAAIEAQASPEETPAAEHAPEETTAPVETPTEAPVQTPAPVETAQTEFVPFDEVEPDYAPAPTAVTPQPAAQDNVWHINYVPAWGAGSAPADGSIGIWADGWFIAHSGMANGDKIATMPQFVEVDGQLYQMTDTWVANDSVSTEEIARCRANNGIVFQTCITDTTNRMVHYEPVNGSGYAYNFTSFPYTANDAVVFGF